jgi:hypothetical protein
MATPPAEPRSADLVAMWVDVERALVATSIAEIDPGEACDRMCGALLQHLGVRCVLLDGHQGGATETVDERSMRFLLGNTVDGNAATLLLTKSEGLADTLDAETLARLRRLFLMLVQIAIPVPKVGQAIHRLRNVLAGLQTNLEIVEMLLPPNGEGGEDMNIALNHALGACREFAQALAELNDVR